MTDLRQKALLERWRSQHPTYAANYMRAKRKYYRGLYKKGKIKYEDIPKAYKYFAEKV